jgi:hypothetical protein
MILLDRPFPGTRYPEGCCEIMTVQQDREYSDERLAFPHTLRVLRSPGFRTTIAGILGITHITA